MANIFGTMAGMVDKIGTMAAASADDIANLTAKSAQSTAGILGDDLAVGAEKSAKFGADKELKAIMSILKGSFYNKLILLPIIFTLSYFLPVAITVLLILGAIYLSYEGVEGILKMIGFHKEEESEDSEKEKINEAIKTDFVLSLEIIVIALSAVIGATFIKQVIVVTLIAMAATFGIYGIVALIVRLDDLGFVLIKKGYPKLGLFCVNSLGWIIKSLAVIGTAAMLLVAGGIITHHIEYLHHINENIGYYSFPFDILIGMFLGFLTLGLLEITKKIKLNFS